MPAVLSRPCVLRFSHHSDDWDKRRIHIDAGATNHFNDFIRDLIAEFAYAHIMNFVRFNDDEAKAGIIDFLETHYLDAHDLVASDFEYLEAIKKADYRLRTLRQSAFFYPSVNNRKRQSPKITAAEIRAMHDLSCEL